MPLLLLLLLMMMLMLMLLHLHLHLLLLHLLLVVVLVLLLLLVRRCRLAKREGRQGVGQRVAIGLVGGRAAAATGEQRAKLSVDILRHAAGGPRGKGLSRRAADALREPTMGVERG